MNRNAMVKHSLDVISQSDSGLQADMDMSRNGQEPDGIIGNFELAASSLLPYDPISRENKQEGKGIMLLSLSQ